MVDYNIVKECRSCKVTYVVSKGESKKNFCDTCQARIDKEKKEEIEKEI